MKKSKKIILTLMAFGLAVSLYACGTNIADSSVSGSGSSSDASSSADSSTDSGSSSDSQTSEDSDSSDSSNSSEEPEIPVDVGVFAEQLWVGTDGTLDFASGTLTGTTEFKVTGVSGEKAETEISVTADGSDYIFKLNAAGALEMYSSAAAAEEGSAPLKTFMADASAFGGAWMADDPYVYVYYVIDSVLNAEGELEWDQLSKFTDEALEAEGTAVTKFSFDEEGKASVSLVMLSWEYPHAVVSYDDEGALRIADDWGEYAFLPYTEAFGSSASYLTEGGDKLVFDGEEGTIAYNGQSASYEAAAGEYGSGLKFTVGGKDYLLQRRFSGFYVISSDGAEGLAAYSPDRIRGDWSSASGAFTISVDTDDKLVFNGTEYPLNAYAKDGEVLYDFTVNGVSYTIRPIAGVDVAFSLETEAVRHQGYYVLDEVKKTYVATYTNNVENLTVDEDYFITVTSLLDAEEVPATYQGSFTYLPDLQCIALVYGGNAATMKNYMVLVEEAGVYWSLVKSGNSYAVYASYYLLELVPEVEKLFNAGLTDEASDFYTTGGTEPESVSFDFANGTVIWNGSPYRFIWNYETNEIGSSYPSIVFLTDIQTDADGNPVSYNYHSIRTFDKGLQMTTFNTASQEDDTVYAYYISDSVFQDILGISFTYRGEYYDEKMILNEDGSFAIATTDKTDSDSAVSMAVYPYFLQRFFGTDGKENIIIAFNSSGTLYIYAYIVDREYVKIFDIVYSADDILDSIGTYYAGADSIEFTRDAGVKVNGTGAEVASVTKTASSVTVTYTYEATEYTAVFSGDTAVVTAAGGNAVTYIRGKFTRGAFVGTYSFDGKVIVVSSSATGINSEPSLNVTVDGTAATATLAFTEEGKQRLSFSVLDFSTFETTVYSFILDGETLTLSNGTDTATFVAAKWDYSDFVFEGTKTLTDSDGATHTLVCLPKNGGKTPLFLYDGSETALYEVTIAADGSMTLEVTGAGITLQIKVTADGTVTADYKPSDIPLPPPLPFAL